MTVTFIEWKPERILDKVETVLLETGRQLGEEAKVQISTVQFDWPNPTLRFTSLFMGGLAGGTRGDRFSPPTTAVGARNTKRFKGGVQSGRFRGRGVYISEGPRDAVDTGELLRSQTAPTVRRGRDAITMTIRWTAPYSGVVLFGGDYGTYVNPDGAVVNVGVKPGRNWIGKTFESKPPMEVFSNIWRGGS